MTKPLSDRHILIVEDEAIIGMYTEDTLSDAGAIVIGPVATLADAFAALERDGTIHAVALDLNLKGESSAPFADALAERRMPFILLTGYDGKGIPAAHRERPVINKPFNPETLVNAFAEILKGSR